MAIEPKSDWATTTDVLANRRPWSIVHAGCLIWLRSLPDDSVDLLFTSPPYERARLYLENGEDLGIARDTEEWVSWMLSICEEARRVCRGLCAFVVEGQTIDRRYTASPFLLAADLHRRGFNLRKPCVFRRNGVPGSGGSKAHGDWLRNDWEPIICFSRPGKLPWSCPTACGKPCKFPVGGRMSNRNPDGRRVNAGLADRPRVKRGRDRKPDGQPREGVAYRNPEIANPGNVIRCKVGGGHMGHPLAHQNEAPFPQSLAEFFVRTFCPIGGVVCDPFSGSGTTVAAAVAWQRRGIGCDLRESQVRIARQRVSETTPTMFPE